MKIYEYEQDKNNCSCRNRICRIIKCCKKQSPIIDKDIEDYLATKKLNLVATTNERVAYEKADFVIIATPTNYDMHKNYFDTSSVESVIRSVIEINPMAIIVKKSTVPVGYTKNIMAKYNCNRIVFSPEFLREGRALYDNLYPSRIIVGSPKEQNDKCIKYIPGIYILEIETNIKG